MLSESHRIPVIYIPLLGFARFVKDLIGIPYKKINGRFAGLEKRGRNNEVTFTGGVLL